MLLNIFLGLLVIIITVIIQGYGTNYWLQILRGSVKEQSIENYQKKGARMLIFTSIFLIFMHLFQAGIWASLYLLIPGINEFDTFEKSMYFSLVTFTTLGYGEITIGSENRILAGLEAVNGIILIGWSTAFMFTVFLELMNKSRGRNIQE